MLNPRSVSVICEFNPPHFTQVDDSSRVTVPGCESLQRLGEPVLPFRTVRILLPPGFSVDKVAASPLTDQAVLDGVWVIEHGRRPVRTPSPRASTAGSSPDEGPNQAIYQSEEFFPSARAELVSIQRMADFEVAFIRVFPLQYSPAQHQLVFAPQLRVELTLSPRDTARPVLLSTRKQGQTRDLLAGLVDNPEMLTNYAKPSHAGFTAMAATADYLLITKSNLVTAFQPLLNQKMQDGLVVRVETVENITTVYTGRDLAEKIRNFIKYAYTNWGLTYVLLGGDSTTVPCRYAYADVDEPELESYLPCDLYFACLDGSWNRDGDNRWGEPTDGDDGGDVDLLAEVYVGRAPVDTAIEVASFVAKTLRYETQGHGNPADVLLMAEYLGNYVPGGHVQGAVMFDPLLPLLSNYQVTWLDDRPAYVPQWNTGQALQALNRSPHLALFNGHGEVDSMMRMYISDLDALTNTWPIFVYSVGCNAGQFDNDKFSPDSIGEEWVKRNQVGAFAAILNSRVGWFDPPQPWKYSGEFQTRFFQAWLEKGHTNLGKANQISKHDMLGQVETSGLMTYRWCLYEINLIGDPHLALKSKPPQPSNHLLTVASLHGGAIPPTGANTFSNGIVLSCSVTNSPLSGGAGTQYVCAGWTGSGSAPAQGSGTQVVFAITNESTLTWNWKTQFWIAAGTAGNGATSLTNGWKDADMSNLVVQAIPSAYYHFVRWQGDVPLALQSNAWIQLPVDQPRNLTAFFGENLTSQGTPEWWLAQYGWTNQFETAAASDTDCDGMFAWQEYVANTSPIDPTSVFKVSLASGVIPGANGILRWPSSANHVYAIYQATNLAPDSFKLIVDAIPATPPVNVYTNQWPGSKAAFYRLSVRKTP